MKKNCFAVLCLAAAGVIMAGCNSGNRVEREDAEVETAGIEKGIASEQWNPDSVVLSIAMTGDVMMGTSFPENGGYLPANGGKNLFDDAGPILRAADVAAGNLEGTLLDGEGERRAPGAQPEYYFVFRMPTEYVGNLVAAGYDFMGMANNHVNDFGPTGRKSTLATLRDAGIATAGLRGVCEFDVIERKGLKIGITQMGHSANTLSINDYGEVRRVLDSLRRECDVMIVSFHGGAEGRDKVHVPFERETYVGENRGNVAEFARMAVDAGADVVFGHGPHVPRGAEIYKDRIIFYSLGNFCTPYRMGLTAESGYAPIAEVRIDGRGRFIDGQIHSFIQQRGIGPRKDSGNSAAKLMRALSEKDFASSPLHIAADGKLSRK